MKHIAKGREPPKLRRWRLENQSTPQALGYANIPSDANEQLRLALLREQGYLCAYTMMRIKDARAGHIEHIRAQSRTREEPLDHSDIDYFNIVYCRPGPDEPRCRYGAQAKDDAVVTAENFVSPLDPTCELRFDYSLDGKIHERNPMDSAARETIGVLRLNDGVELQDARGNAIRALPIFTHSSRRLSSAEARRMNARLAQRDEQGRFRPFTPALRHFLTRYAEQRAARDAALASQHRKS